MTPIRELNSDQINEETLVKYIPRTAPQIESIQESVVSIIHEVKEKGDKAIIKFTKDFDNVETSTKHIQVTDKEISDAYDKSDADLIKAIRYAKENLIKFHKAQVREDWLIEIEKGVSAGQIYRPLGMLGIYIPGGRAIYPSTVLMVAAPAYVAGIEEIIMCSPPQQDNKIASALLIAANEFGINKIFKVGGAQAIAAMAYGTETIPKVQKVVGPGSIWVNAAKQLLSNIIAIDSPAGPSEILIICDESANPNYVIVDLLSQIEHDPDNIGIIVSDSVDLINQIKDNIEEYVVNSKRRDIIEKALLNNSLIIKAEDTEDCIRISNLIAPEHLEILTKEPNEIIKKIINAGAIFLGPFSPVSLGDYCAGTNHVLPTGGSAKIYSGLNLYDFLKTIDVLKCDREGLKKLSSTAIKLSEFEGMFSHKRSIEERLKDKN
ncbi:MAG: histidinol dehydrogenase [Candidatus Lokiarchaeota archaeon]|nr:histidinol dehydrogenase [Candidatus Lokiarchaeota archaeon]